jgi:uncharacterized phage protein (TIGR01671 family)
MNREILFRGKRKDNGKWVYGGIIRLPAKKIMNIEFEEEIVIEKYLSSSDNFVPHCNKVEPKSIGQFTGAFDKNDNKIFEGDIVEMTVQIHLGNEFDGEVIEGCRHEVIFNSHDCRFELQNMIYPDLNQPLYMKDSMIIIGNKFENSDFYTCN